MALISVVEPAPKVAPKDFNYGVRALEVLFFVCSVDSGLEGIAHILIEHLQHTRPMLFVVWIQVLAVQQHIALCVLQASEVSSNCGQPRSNLPDLLGRKQLHSETPREVHVILAAKDELVEMGFCNSKVEEGMEPGANDALAPLEGI